MFSTVLWSSSPAYRRHSPSLLHLGSGHWAQSGLDSVSVYRNPRHVPTVGVGSEYSPRVHLGVVVLHVLLVRVVCQPYDSYVSVCTISGVQHLVTPKV